MLERGEWRGKSREKWRVGRGAAQRGEEREEDRRREGEDGDESDGSKKVEVAVHRTKGLCTMLHYAKRS